MPTLSGLLPTEVLPNPEVFVFLFGKLAPKKRLKVEFGDYCHHLCSGGNSPWCGGKGFRCECPGRCELSHSAVPPVAIARETGQTNLWWTSSI